MLYIIINIYGRRSHWETYYTLLESRDRGGPGWGRHTIYVFVVAVTSNTSTGMGVLAYVLRNYVVGVCVRGGKGVRDDFTIVCVVPSSILT